MKHPLRLIRSMWVRGELPITDVDVDVVVAQTAERWTTVASRVWRVDARGGTVQGSADRLRACLDTRGGTVTLGRSAYGSADIALTVPVHPVDPTAPSAAQEHRLPRRAAATAASGESLTSIS